MKIALGTAQFGLDYGITNSAGQVARDEIRELLDLAAAQGVDLLDTAPAYGSSEEAVGEAGIEAFRVVTKIPKLRSRTQPDAVDELRRSFEASLNRLRTGRVFGFLFHDPADLLGPLGDALWKQVDTLRSEGLAEKIGASFYSGDHVDQALVRYPLGLVQVPFNAFDRRLVEGGQLARLAEAGVEVHARSLFLQGVLLADQLPARFGSIAGELERLRRAAQEASMTQIEGLLAIAFQRREISRFVCGVTTTSELKQILYAAAVAERSDPPPDYSPGPIDERILSPQRWDELNEP